MPLHLRRVVAVLCLAALIAACGGAATPMPATPRPSLATPALTPPAATDAAESPPASDAPEATDDATPTTAAFDPAAVRVALEEVVDIPGAPLAVGDAGDGSGRLFVAERGGRVWIVRDGQRSDAPFLDIAIRVTAGGEAGLLGLAFHPGFPDDPRFYVYYTNRDRDQVVAERRVSADDADRADPIHERELLVMDDFAANHNGGALAFGPDGHLYVATGDGGGAGDPQETGQRLDTHLGKILRLAIPEPDAEEAYGIPADNPFAGRDGAMPEIWHLGLRNPWRFSFDRQTGDLWIGDVGQNQWEEIDVARGGEGGLNFGWSVTEGRHCFRENDCAMDGLVAPVTEYSHDQGCSVTGGVVYRGEAYPELRGAYVFGDFCSGLVWAIDAASDEVAEPTVVAETGVSISAFGEDQTGEVWVTDLGGRLFRLTATTR